MDIITFDGHDYIIEECKNGKQYHVWDSDRKLYQGEVWRDDAGEYWHYDGDCYGSIHVNEEDALNTAIHCLLAGNA